MVRLTMALAAAKISVVENFEALEAKLDLAVDQGLIDEGASYYNQISTLMDDAKVAESWDELDEVIYKGKILETDLDVWLSSKGDTTIGLEWPNVP